MCDIDAFLITDGGTEKVLEHVELVEDTEGGLRLVNIFGEERILQAKMVHYNNSAKRMLLAPQ